MNALAQTAAVPWKRGVVWLLFLGPFFFLSYGFTNNYAASKVVTDSIVFGWERNIPFVPWTIVPYWSIDLFYGLSFLLCFSALQVDRHALRLLTAQLVSVICFILVPLRFTFDRPETGGLFGQMFDVLMGFDKPYNQAPSLHISLLVIIWLRFAASTRGIWNLLTHLWAALICLSVLTTYQHHFFDIPTGLALGFFCLWLWPDHGTPPLSRWQFTTSAARRKLAAYYLLAAMVAGVSADFFAGFSLWLWWPALSLFMVAAIYAGIGVEGFQKSEGKHSIASRVLLAPYFAGAWLNSRWWTRRRPSADEIADGVCLGRLPTQREMRAGNFDALLDLTAELPAPQGEWKYATRPWLDMVAPDAEQLAAAAAHIEQMRGNGRVLVSCALGYSRSACAVAAWLLLTGRAKTAEEALLIIAAHRPQVVLGETHKRALNDCLQQFAKGTSSHV